MPHNRVDSIGVKVLSRFPEGLKSGLRAVIPLKAKRYLGKKIMRKAVGGSQKTVRVIDGRTFTVIEDRLFLRVFLDKNYEPPLTEIARKLVQKNDITIDVGANFGWYSTLFGTLIGENGKNIAYEPLSRSREILTENVALNDLNSNVEIRGVCVGESAGKVFIDQGDSSESGLAHVVDTADSATVEVSVVCLEDDLAQFRGNIAYIKIDIEGYEYFALKGARSILNVENQPVLQLEMNDVALERSGTSRRHVTDLLQSLGYQFYETSESGFGKLTQCNPDTCSDVFCFGNGVYSERLHLVS